MKHKQRESQFERSGAGVVALYCAGIYEGNEIDNGLKYLMKFKPSPNGNANMRFRPQFGGRGFNHYFYGHYYAAQAMWTAGGKYWQELVSGIREEPLCKIPAK